MYKARHEADKRLQNCIGPGCYAWTEWKKKQPSLSKNRKIEFLILAMRQ